MVKRKQKSDRRQESDRVLGHDPFEGLDMEWVTSTAEKRPFRHPTQMHSFAPSLISEIKVESMSLEEYQKQSNPYYQQMQRNGLSGVMNQNFNKGY